MAEHKGAKGGFVQDPTNTWDNTSPTDSTIMSAVDDEIRLLKLDTQERMDRQHWFSEDDYATNKSHWRGAHRRSLVNVCHIAAGTTALETWTDANMGATVADRKPFGGALAVLDTTSKGIYCMRQADGIWFKAADKA